MKLEEGRGLPRSGGKARVPEAETERAGEVWSGEEEM